MYRYKVLFVLLLAIMFLFSACESRDEVGFKDSRAEYMAEYQKEFSEHGIPFHMSSEGHIIYPSEYAEDVERIKKEVSDYTNEKLIKDTIK